MAPTRKPFSAKFKAEVLKYITEKGCSNSAAAKHFGIDEKNRRWKTQSGSLHAVIKNRFSKAKQLPGSGRRPLSEDLEELVYQWIVSKRLQKQRVTRKGIQQKAVELYNSIIKGEPEFQGSKGWLEKFRSHYSLSLRRKTTQSQQLAVDLVLKIHRFILYFRKLMTEKSYHEEKIWAFDETAVWFDSVGNTTIEKVGSKEVEMFTTGHDKQNITVGLCASSTGKKKLPYIIFRGKGNTAEDKQLKARKDIEINYSDNGWFNTDLTLHWLHKNFQSFFTANTPDTVLVWDAYKCRIAEVKQAAKKLSVDLVTVPGGTTSKIQAPDVSWNKPSKASIVESFDDWVANGKKSYTPKGNICAASKTLLCDWVVKAWKSLSPDLIRKSFCVCGQVKDVDIDETTCLKQGSSLHDSKSSLPELMKLSPDETDYEQLKRKEGSKGSVCIENEADVWEENRNEIVIDNLLEILEEDIGNVLQN